MNSVEGVRIIRSTEADITRLTGDSREVGPGSLFFALRGGKADGHAFLGEAARRGAAGWVVERLETVPEDAPALAVVPDSRLALARAAQRMVGDPSARLNMVGVTGTNGKTTVTYLLRACLEAAGHRTGLFGTVGYDLAGEKRPAGHTTPGPVELAEMLARLLERGGEFAVMEVSSHALAQHRVAGCEFDLGIFTNLTRDHLDFHGTMEEYFEAKRKLFTGLAGNDRASGPAVRPSKARKGAVVNRDDDWGGRLLEHIPVAAVTYGLEGPADLTAVEVVMTLERLSFRALTPAGDFPIRSRLTGRHNVYNILAAIGGALHFGIPVDSIRDGIGGMEGVPGRMERLDSGLGFNVIVDYAHTEDALERLLRAVRDLTHGRVLTVFGCGGDRDRGKRAPMGRAAARLSDLVVLTSDNPRTEDPSAILLEIEKGAREGAVRKVRGVEILALLDRREAIEKTLGLARPGDAVVIAGKGHEAYQIIGTQSIPFSDRETVLDWIRRRGAGGRGGGF